MRDRLAERGFEFPTHDELASDLEGVQGLKKTFFRRFWMVSGREAVRAMVAAQLETVSAFCDVLNFVNCVVLILMLFSIWQENADVEGSGRQGGTEGPLTQAGTLNQDAARRE